VGAVPAPEPGAVTLIVAVKVTGWLDTDGFTEEATVVVVDALLTVCVIAEDVLVLQLTSPP